jgi:hypothetical protein
LPLLFQLTWASAFQYLYTKSFWDNNFNVEEDDGVDRGEKMFLLPCTKSIQNVAKNLMYDVKL